MKPFFLVLILSNALCCLGQAASDSTKFKIQDSVIGKNHDLSGRTMVRPNSIKINIYPLLINSYSLIVERIITRKISVQIGYRYQPYGYLLNNIPGKKLAKHGSVDPEYANFQTGNYAVTLDTKFYTGRKSKGPRGLFYGIYGRYAHFDLDNTDYIFVSNPETNALAYNVQLVSNVSGFGIGLLSGWKWIIKKRVVVELYSGIQYQKFKGNLSSHKDLKGLNDQDKMNLKDNIEKLFTIGNTKYLTADVNENGVNGTISGPSFGIRSGLSIGIIF